MKAKFFLYTAIAVIVFGCSENKTESSEMVATATDTTVTFNTERTESKVIKTADMRFRVKDVLHTKTEIGNTLKGFGGTIAELSINSSINKSEKVRYSADSLKEITSYTTQGTLVARVPSEKLDDFTESIIKLAVFVDNQSLKLDDQRVHYLENSLKALSRESVLNKTANLGSKKGDVEKSINVNDNIIDRRMNNMMIDDKVKFSTITLDFYQDNTIKTTLVANDDISDFRPPFFRRLGLNIVNGWILFEEFILAMANIWMLFVLVAAGFFTYKYYNRKRNA